MGSRGTVSNKSTRNVSQLPSRNTEVSNLTDIDLTTSQKDTLVKLFDDIKKYQVNIEDRKPFSIDNLTITKAEDDVLDNKKINVDIVLSPDTNNKVLKEQDTVNISVTVGKRGSLKEKYSMNPISSNQVASRGFSIRRKRYKESNNR